MAGVSAAVLESVVLYPLDFMKTEAQLLYPIANNYLSSNATASNPASSNTNSANVHGTSRHARHTRPLSTMFSGCSALVTGNVIRAMARFSVYNAAAKFMSDSSSRSHPSSTSNTHKSHDGDNDSGHASTGQYERRGPTAISAPQAVVAGMMTGFVESLIVVPFENIKTTMVETTLRRSVGSPVSSTSINTTPKPTTTPKLKSKPITLPTLFSTISTMHQTRGLRSFVQGFTPTIMRQVVNSGVQFSTYTFFKQALHGGIYSSKDAPIPVSLALVAGALSGAAAVAASQPLDVVKTRMMGIGARGVVWDKSFNKTINDARGSATETIEGVSKGRVKGPYTNTLKTISKILTQEGLLAFWAGSIPRYFLIVVGSSMTFGVYEVGSQVLEGAVREMPFGG